MQEQYTSSNAQPSQTVNQRVLILDDNEMVGRTLTLMCERFDGLSAQLCTHADDFFHAFETWLPTHVVLDLSMPEMDGIEVMKALSERSHRAGIIIASGMGARVIESARKYADESGLKIVGVLEKPVSPRQFRELLARPLAAENAAGVSAEMPRHSIDDAAIRRALDCGEFVPYYQPRIDCMTGNLAGFEALARWQHPDFGVLLPNNFIPRLESNGWIDEFTGMITGDALDWFANASLRGFGLTLSLNISRASLGPHGLINFIQERARKHNIDPRRIILEVTETGVMADPSEAIGAFTRVRTSGFELAIDDFGIGYSSMSQLVRLPFSEIKIDHSFVGSMLKSREAHAAVKCIIELAANLDMRVTAEGVESLECYRKLQDMGCDFAQGFFFAQALSADDVVTWSERWNATRLTDWKPIAAIQNTG